jgi:non-lysosomal glucosylceramidase
MAKRMGEPATADRFHSVFEKGQKRLVELCWNGEYFQQHLPDYLQRSGEYGPGCLSDQLIGQWWAHQLGLGYILPEDKVKTALKSIFKYNWLPDFRNFQHNWRKFAGGKDKGLLICTWPRGGRPANTIPYVDEVWTGVEYQVAAHMAYEGMLEEALSIVKGARDRYDGVPRAPMPRNPWNEIECGGHYARAMSSWSVLLALSGYDYDGPSQRLRFVPRVMPDNFKSFFTGPEGWGSVKQVRKGKAQHNEIAVVEGTLKVAHLHLDAPSAKRVGVTLSGKAIPATFKSASDGVVVTFAAPVTIPHGQTLAVNMS